MRRGCLWEVQNGVDGSFPLGCRCRVTPDTENTSSSHGWLPSVRANMLRSADPQTFNAILLDKEYNPIALRFDDGVSFSAGAHEGNLVVPSPALLLLAELVAQVDCTV